MIDALQDKREGVRHAVTNALAQIGDTKVIPLLLATASEEQTWHSHPSVSALQKLGVPSKTQEVSSPIKLQQSSASIQNYKAIQDDRTGALLTQTNVSVNTTANAYSTYYEQADSSWMPSLDRPSSLTINPAILAPLADKGYKIVRQPSDDFEESYLNAFDERDCIAHLISTMMNGTPYSRLCAANELYDLCDTNSIEPLCAAMQSTIGENYCSILWLLQCIVVQDTSTLLEVPASLLPIITNDWTLVCQEVYNEAKFRKNSVSPIKLPARKRNNKPKQPPIKTKQKTDAPKHGTDHSPLNKLQETPKTITFTLDMNSVQQKIAETAQVQELCKRTLGRKTRLLC